MSANNVNPGALFGGTWEQIKDKFILSAGDNYSAGTTGGSSSITYTPRGSIGNTTLTAAQSGLPDHTHTFTNPVLSSHSHSVPAQSVQVSGSGHLNEFNTS